MIGRRRSVRGIRPSTGWFTAVAAALAVAPAVALAAPNMTFAGKTGQKIKISFHVSGGRVAHMATDLDVFCLTAYPSNRSEIQFVTIAPKATAPVRNGNFTFKLPTQSKNSYTVLTGKIRGTKASGSIKTYYMITWLVYNPSSGLDEFWPASCAGKTTWTANAGH